MIQHEARPFEISAMKPNAKNMLQSHANIPDPRADWFYKSHFLEIQMFHVNASWKENTRFSLNLLSWKESETSSGKRKQNISMSYVDASWS